VQVNVGGAINVALACIKYNVYLIQISSGCIYGGGIDREFTEDDAPNFFGSFYSRMRIVMQDALKELPVLQIRIRMPISMKSHPRNFINKITSYTRVISVPNSVTLIEDLCPAIEKLASIRPTGILNLTNDGYIEHKNVLKIYKKIVNPDHLYIAITLEELEGSGGIIKAKRSNCILSNKKARELGISMPALDDERLEKIMEEYKKTL
jgi:dTDP-4-dehydrorhamnose reductase